MWTQVTTGSGRPAPPRSHGRSASHAVSRGARVDEAMRLAVSRREEVFERLRSERDRIRRLGVSRLGLFGSFARDEATAESDVDFLVEFEPGGKSFRRFMATVFLLEELLGREVELVTPEGLSPYLRDEISRSAVDVGP